MNPASYHLRIYYIINTMPFLQWPSLDRDEEYACPYLYTSGNALPGMVLMRLLIGVDLRYAFSLPDSPASLPLCGREAGSHNYRP